jgi:hypothetical protein
VFNTVYNFAVAHPIIFQAIYTTMLGMWSAYVSSLRAPTAQSSQAYVSFFAIANYLAFNFSRAKTPKVEDSPNFQAALNLQQRDAGQRETVAKPQPPSGTGPGS